MVPLYPCSYSQLRRLALQPASPAEAILGPILGSALRDLAPQNCSGSAMVASISEALVQALSEGALLDHLCAADLCNIRIVSKRLRDLVTGRFPNHLKFTLNPLVEPVRSWGCSSISGLAV